MASVRICGCRSAALLVTACLLAAPARGVPAAQEASSPTFGGRSSMWRGYVRHDFTVADRAAIIVEPHRVAAGRPWVWRARFFGHEPQADLALLAKGFHLAYVDVAGLFGSPEAVSVWDTFYDLLTREHGLARRVALEGMSRGGLIVYNWAAAHPDRVACIYADAPVCDFKSWPAGVGSGRGDAASWAACLKAYGMTEAEALAYRGNPIDRLEPLARAGVPLLHVCGDADDVVPVAENTAIVERRYRALGGHITVVLKKGVGHHPHSLEDPEPIVRFILESTGRAPAGAPSGSTADRGPVDAAGRPRIRKLGTIDCDLVETTPFVFRGRVYRLEWARTSYRGNRLGKDYLRVVERQSGREVASFGEGCRFASAFVEGGSVYAIGTRTQHGWYGHTLTLFATEDLKSWSERTVLDDPRYGICNTSLCRAGDHYVLMFEIHQPTGEAGVPFTARFATSPDLRVWTVTPPDHVYAKDRYSAPHCLRYDDGWYYDFYLEAGKKTGWEQWVARSRDLIHWRSSPLNPVLAASDEDRRIARPSLDDDERHRIASATDVNNSDIDFCEFEGRLIINYSWGNQQGAEFLAEAEYDGTLAQFLQGWFPEKDAE